MAVDQGRVTVTTAATEVVVGVRGAGTVKFSADVYVGGPDVTTSNGFPLSAGDTFSLDLARSDSLYAITASGTATAYYVTNLGV